MNAVTFSQDGSLLASGSDDRTVRLWDPRTGQEIQTLKGHTGSVNAVAFSQDGSLLASGSYDDTVRLWDPRTGQEIQTLKGHTHSVYAVAFSQDGSLLASGSYDGTVRLWDLRTGQEVQTFENILGVTTISFTIDNTTILTNRGAMSINNETITFSDYGSSTYNTMIRIDWVQRGNRNYLWLPQEYRTNCSTFYGNILALGRKSGQVSFIQFDES